MATHHSLLFHGFGSKRQLLQDFAKEELRKEGDIVIFKGYDKQLNIKELLDVLVYNYLNGRDPFQEILQENHMESITTSRLNIQAPPCLVWNPLLDFSTKQVGVTPPTTKCSIEVQRAIAIAKKLQSRSRPIYIIMHNIDGPALRNHVAQECLAALTAHSAGIEKEGGSGFRSIRLVASVDHINAASVLWDTKISSNFSWVCINFA